MEYSLTFHWGNHLNGAKSQTTQSGKTVHWQASIMLLLKNIFTSNSLCRIGISRCPPFPGCDWVSSPLIFLFSGFLVHRSTSALDKASVLFCYMSLLTSWCYDSPDIHRPIQSLKKLISNSQIQIVAKILSDLSCTVWHDCCYRIVYRCHYRQLSAVT